MKFFNYAIIEEILTYRKIILAILLQDYSHFFLHFEYINKFTTITAEKGET